MGGGAVWGSRERYGAMCLAQFGGRCGAVRDDMDGMDSKQILTSPNPRRHVALAHLAGIDLRGRERHDAEEVPLDPTPLWDPVQQTKDLKRAQLADEILVVEHIPHPAEAEVESVREGRQETLVHLSEGHLAGACGWSGMEMGVGKA